MRTPYTTKTGVKIGIRYQPPMPGLYPDEERLQTALLKSRKPKHVKPWVIVVLSVLCYLLAGLAVSFK